MLLRLRLKSGVLLASPPAAVCGRSAAMGGKGKGKSKSQGKSKEKNKPAGQYRVPVSKAMSRILRHQARDIDPAGWVTMKVLLDSPELKQLGADAVEVMAAVDFNDKN